jgi:predicted regulator of Ras-like GTPase activity (Roadblock/LC7/MglB family)
VEEGAAERIGIGHWRSTNFNSTSAKIFIMRAKTLGIICAGSLVVDKGTNTGLIHKYY